MRKHVVAGLGIMIAGIIAVSGCRSKDQTFARQVIDGIYAGSLSSVRDSMTPRMQQAMANDAATAKVGTGLRQQYGRLKSLELKSHETVSEQGQEFDQETWTVTAERGKFEMRLVMDRNGKLAGLWFQPASAQ